MSPDVATLLAERERLQRDNQALKTQLTELQRQLEWFKRQIFGRKSERRVIEPNPHQLALGEGVEPAPAEAAVEHTVAAHTRRRRPSAQQPPDESALFFDENVPVETIEVVPPEFAGACEAEFERIGEKVSFRLAQRPGSYVILKYVRPQFKRKHDGALRCAPAPDGVLGTSRADVSFIAGLVIDKFQYHLPLYRQHQRLEHSGVHVSRAWLTDLVHAAAELLAPIQRGVLDSIRSGHVIAMDETPIKAGRKSKGKMNTGYFWPVYGDADEVCFLFYPSRAQQCVLDTLGRSPPAGQVLITDGYAAYARYAERTGLTHAQCWAHARRQLLKAEAVEPERVARGLDFIARLYRIELQIREQRLSGKAKQIHRAEHARPVLEAFFDWVEQELADQALLPSSPFTQALGYVRERRAGLEVFVADPDVPLDTNHLERALRPIPIGKKNWLFAWTEAGAEDVAVLQTLIASCRLQNINPYDYLVDVLQRIDRHPAKELDQLTPRQWKQRFADQPLRSPLHTLSP